jgi:hypothetical protein
MLEEEEMSTSPAVLLSSTDPGKTITMESGSTLFIEGKPSLLDHCALLYSGTDEGGVGLGVWDKGGPSAGVDATAARVDSALDAILFTMKLDEIAWKLKRLCGNQR